jgi:hypothetical protein
MRQGGALVVCVACDACLLHGAMCRGMAGSAGAPPAGGEQQNPGASLAAALLAAVARRQQQQRMAAMASAPGPGLSEVLKPEVLGPLLQDPEVRVRMNEQPPGRVCAVAATTRQQLLQLTHKTCGDTAPAAGAGAARDAPARGAAVTSSPAGGWGDAAGCCLPTLQCHHSSSRLQAPLTLCCAAPSLDVATGARAQPAVPPAAGDVWRSAAVWAARPGAVWPAG